MLNLVSGPATARAGSRLSRRAFLRVGALGLGGLTLADLLRQQARASVTGAAAHKAVIMVYLPGGPSHIDMYDMKPDAPVEIRGEFRPIRTNVPGLDVCELMPLQTRIADKLAVVRGFQTPGGHDSRELTTGFRAGVYRPAFGSVVSRVRPNPGPGLPPYVTLVEESNLPFGQNPAYLGPAHGPLSIRGPGLANLTLARGMTAGRLADRTDLLRRFDAVRRDVHERQDTDGLDPFTARALEMVTTSRTREAFDLDREAPQVRDRYGRLAGSQQFLLARRLVEAGVRVVTLCGGWEQGGDAGAASNLSNWDTHDENFPRLRRQLPHLDRALAALITDLAERGLAEDVAVVVCGEMGRAPRVGVPNPGSQASATGRDHWPTGFALLAGGGLRMGQVVGATDRRGERATSRPYTPQNLLATMYHVLGIDTGQTFRDHFGRPQYLLDDGAPISELV
jgi:uncharacterized protein (DUF1501 family)